MKLKPVPKLILFLLIVGGGIYGFRQAVYSGIIPRPNVLKSVIPVKADDITAEVIAHDASNVKLVAMPTTTAAPPCMDGNTRNCLSSALFEGEIWAWNGNGGLIFATGGATSDKGIQTAKGSLMEKYGINVRLQRQDDTNQMKTDLISTATRLKTDPNASGIKFITIMGDQGGATMKDMEKACPTCDFEVMGVIGYSRGEDGVWSTPEIKADPQKARGALWIMVVREGDWNIAMKWAGQNGIPVNPDDSYDPNALNIINADSYTKAVEMLIQPGGFCVDLPIKGKIGGGTQHVCANGVATWTPGDVTLAKNKGGYVPIMTTKDAPFMMPTTMIGIKSWNTAHFDEVVRFFAAIFEAGDNIRANPAALQKMGEISAKLYNEQNADYWVKYYKGVVEPDKQGIRVPLGGSSVMNLADALQSFGLNGGPCLFCASYNTFGKIVVQQYPKLYPDFPPVTKVLNTKYVAGVKSLGTLQTDNAEKVVTTSSTASMKSIEGRRNYSIQFATGSAEILPASIPTMNQLVDDIIITKYAVAVHGHTDNTGTPDGNMALSEARANSVAAYLKRKGVVNVLRTYAHGQEEPIGDNATAAGKATNRRVQIVLGNID